MIVQFDSSFSKSLNKIKDPTVKKRILLFIEMAEKVNSLTEIPSVTKLTGFKTFYRYRIGKYRLGFEQTNPNTLLLILVAKREDIYKSFP